MQGKNENILIIMDNVQGFSVMLKLWLQHISGGCI
jgi:hypothetical protein